MARARIHGNTIRFMQLLRDSIGLPGECWPWRGRVEATGYPTIGGEPAYRRVWRLFIGEIADGLHLDHLCKNPLCVNPEHLEPVTPYVNNIERSDSPAAIMAKRHACMHGHEFTEQNTYWFVNVSGRRNRMCRECRRQASIRLRRRAASPSSHT